MEGAGELTREEYLLVVPGRQRGVRPLEPFQCWSMLADQLMASPAPNGDTDLHRLRIAMALRATELHDNCSVKSYRPMIQTTSTQLVARQLEQSLEYDPDDRDTYLRLIDYYRRGRRLKDVRRLLAQASDQWPKDMQMLQAALTTALDSGAFKKAAGIARQMLEIDPINTAVRERLVDAHLSHAHKQLKKVRPDLAHKEISNAKDWARGEPDAGAYRSDRRADHAQQRRRGGRGLRCNERVTEIGGGLAGRIALALAADNFDLSQNQLQKRAKFAKAAAADRRHPRGPGQIARPSRPGRSQIARPDRLAGSDLQRRQLEGSGPGRPGGRLRHLAPL
jgi:tetratricopeptide (TPR) repeat protein